MWEEEETETGSLSETVITQIRNGAEGEVVDTFHDEDVRLIHIGNYSFSYIHNSNSGGILLIDRVRTKNLGAHNRIKNAVNALGGQDELDKLPEYFRERLIANDDLDAKARILEAIVEIKEWV